jgi:lysophospholipase L1-like esterase
VRKIRLDPRGGRPAEFLALGDSYTIGEGVEALQRWPLQLAAALRARGTAVAEPQILARSGWSTDELVDAIDADVEVGKMRSPYDLVSLQIGVNNQYRGREAADYAIEFSYLLGRSVSFAGGEVFRVLVLSIPDWGVTPYARASGRDREQIASEIDAYNAAAAAVCRARHVCFVDITDLTRDPALAEALVADGLHPSAEMYRRWVERVEPLIA